jgi:hypothetical protein
MNTITLLLAATTELPTVTLAAGAVVMFALGMVAGSGLMLVSMRPKPEPDDWSEWQEYRKQFLHELDKLPPEGWRHDRSEH